tara:strand:- start:46 stop:495 length:450 start_codon:yes stop_codon:yes gene_type:complete
MQTFLPYESFTKTAQVLDWRRLGKQRVEGMQIIKAIENPKPQGWKNHPIVKMWTPYVPALKQYTNIIITEWIARGYNNNMEFYDIDNVEYPDWLGDERFHASHRANLLRKDFEFYSQYNWTENSESPYVWRDNNGWYEQQLGTKERFYL